MLIYSFINYPFVIMCSKRSENIIGGDKLAKRARNVLPLEKKLDVLNRLGPVSYTHLDVYKRQVYIEEKTQRSCKEGTKVILIFNLLMLCM